MRVNENSNMKQQDKETLALKMQVGDLSGVHMTGHITDRIFDKNGNLIEERVGHNLVVNSFLNLVMCLLKQQNGYSGIQYWAVGSGAGSYGLYYSTDGMTWTKCNGISGTINAICNVNGIWVAGGKGLYYSKSA